MFAIRQSFEVGSLALLRVYLYQSGSEQNVSDLSMTNKTANEDAKKKSNITLIMWYLKAVLEMSDYSLAENKGLRETQTARIAHYMLMARSSTILKTMPEDTHFAKSFGIEKMEWTRNLSAKLCKIR